MDTYRLARHIIAYRPGKDIAVGYILDFMGEKAPDGWLFCEGQKVGKQQYPELYAVVGDAYQRQIKNPIRRWYMFWEPKTIPEPLFYDFRLPDFRGKIL